MITLLSVLLTIVVLGGILWLALVSSRRPIVDTLVLAVGLASALYVIATARGADAPPDKTKTGCMKRPVGCIVCGLLHVHVLNGPSALFVDQGVGCTGDCEIWFGRDESCPVGIIRSRTLDGAV